MDGLECGIECSFWFSRIDFHGTIAMCSAVHAACDADCVGEHKSFSAGVNPVFRAAKRPSLRDKKGWQLAGLEK
jgi:hypothetical protein